MSPQLIQAAVQAEINQRLRSAERRRLGRVRRYRSALRVRGRASGLRALPSA